jgi:hypothetical protein
MKDYINRKQRDFAEPLGAARLRQPYDPLHEKLPKKSNARRGGAGGRVDGGSGGAGVEPMDSQIRVVSMGFDSAA